MKKKIAIVTGGAGFIGSHLVDLLLKKKIVVRVIDNFSGGRKTNLSLHKNNPDLRIINKDITKLNGNEKFFENIDYIFHFAGKGDIVPSIENPEDYLTTNVSGTLKILIGSRKSPKLKKFVYAASSSCYGLAKTPTSENHPINTEYPYALSKYMGEMLCHHWQKVYNIPVNSIRIFNAYGPRVKTTGVYGAVFGVFLKQKLSNKPFTVVGTGSQKRDFLYVTDVADAFYRCAISKYVGQIYNLGAGKPNSINKLIKIIKGDKIYLPKRPGEPDITHADITKISKHLNWKPKVSFEKGVKNMLECISEWDDAPLWNKKTINLATKTWFKYMNKNG